MNEFLPRFVWKLLRNANFGEGGGDGGGVGGGGEGGQGDSGGSEGDATGGTAGGTAGEGGSTGAGGGASEGGASGAGGGGPGEGTEGGASTGAGAPGMSAAEGFSGAAAPGFGGTPGGFGAGATGITEATGGQPGAAAMGGLGTSAVGFDAGLGGFTGGFGGTGGFGNPSGFGGSPTATGGISSAGGFDFSGTEAETAGMGITGAAAQGFEAPGGSNAPDSFGFSTGGFTFGDAPGVGPQGEIADVGAPQTTPGGLPQATALDLEQLANPGRGDQPGLTPGTQSVLGNPPSGIEQGTHTGVGPGAVGGISLGGTAPGTDFGGGITGAGLGVSGGGGGGGGNFGVPIGTGGGGGGGGGGGLTPPFGTPGLAGTPGIIDVLSPGGGDILSLGGGAGGLPGDVAGGTGIGGTNLTAEQALAEASGAVGGGNNFFNDLASRLGLTGAGGTGGLGVGGAFGGLAGGGFADWLGGQGLTPDQIAAMTQAQDSLLAQWAQIIPPSDPRWPQVLALVQQQTMQQTGGQSGGGVP